MFSAKLREEPYDKNAVFEGVIGLVCGCIRAIRRQETHADRLLQEEGVRVSVPSPASIRVVPHLGISRADVDTAAASIRALGERLVQRVPLAGRRASAMATAPRWIR